jgi:hypothetical protein
VERKRWIIYFKIRDSLIFVKCKTENDQQKKAVITNDPGFFLMYFTFYFFTGAPLLPRLFSGIVVAGAFATCPVTFKTTGVSVAFE